MKKEALAWMNRKEEGEGEGLLLEIAFLGNDEKVSL